MKIYKVTDSFPAQEQFGLTSQLRRAAVFVPSNIAEGMGRSTKKYFIRFLYQSRGSICEIQAQLHISYNLHYLKKDDYYYLDKKYSGLNAGINSHIESLIKAPGTS